MKDILELISTRLKTDSRAELRREISVFLAALQQSAGKGNRRLVQEAEKSVRLDPDGSFTFDSTNLARLNVNGFSWQAGRFEVRSIASLKKLIKSRGAQVGKLSLVVLDGAGPVTDIGALQATARDCLFQVASQFNCLESPGPYVTNVANYFFDPTQGPRASISAFPATLLRHYRAPGEKGQLFVQQTDGQQIDLLVDACGSHVLHNGYFSGAGLTDPATTVAALESQFEQIGVGVHSEAQVVLGYNWDGSVDDSQERTISQVFTSTVAGGEYGGEQNLVGDLFVRASRQLLRASYLGTLLTAISLGHKRVLLTLIGGGAFQNPIDLIWDSINWALDEVQPFLCGDLEVIVNGRNLSDLISLDKVILPATSSRGGAVISFDTSGLAAIYR